MPLSQLRDFYSHIEELAEHFGVRRLGECTGRMIWPDRGVYFILDPDEPRGGSTPGAKAAGARRDLKGGSLPRIVRVGTHALKRGSSTTLWKRLRQHRGRATGTGNHRGSVFRKHVGRALLVRDGVHHPTWGVGSTAAREVLLGETELEMSVSDYLSRLQVIVVPVLDESGPQSFRGFVERNSIALLSTEGRRAHPPSARWLGHCAPSKDITQSGLWNVRHVRDGVADDFLERLGQLVSSARG